MTAVSASRLLVLVLCLTLPATGFAQRKKSTVPDLEAEGHRGDMARIVQKRANERFDKADEDKDGLITKEEALRHLTYVGENFGKFDKDEDGKLTWEEYIGHDKWPREPAD